ncbi:MAG: rRNA maturation RNase YbeY [Gemmatimonadota bacterium]|nr:rRNA maturation RNase YbeY [Gemmatimonadota bacterium]
MNVVVDPGTFRAADADVLRRAVFATLEAEGAEGVELSLTLLGDEGIRELNREHLGRNRPTDVLAFALDDATGLVGDVYLGFDQARRQAEQHGAPLTEELVRLTIHGTLHVLGYDHPDGDDRYDSPMFGRQERILDGMRDRGVLDGADV